MYKTNISQIISGSFLIAGTSIGAGMLGIPLVTSLAGFWPAVFVTTLVWLFMMATGLLLLEATLWLPDGANFLSISGHFFSDGGRVVTGVMFAFLYYCLMVAYFAAGGPLLMSVIGLGHVSHIWALIIFGIIFASVVVIGPKSIDRVNIILTIAMGISWILLLYSGSKDVSYEKLQVFHLKPMILAIPILFSAFGYHNIIPSLTSYLHRNVVVLRLCIILGTTLPFIVYILWQWLIMGSIDEQVLKQTLGQGLPVTIALEKITKNAFVALFGRFFALFAIITSTLGVAFSLVDFLGDGLKMQRTGFHRLILCILTFIPPMLFAMMNPKVFDHALGIAGGIGEAFLNGILPVGLVWAGRYSHRLSSSRLLFGGKGLLLLLLFVASFVMAIEIYHLMH